MLTLISMKLIIYSTLAFVKGNVTKIIFCVRLRYRGAGSRHCDVQFALTNRDATEKQIGDKAQGVDKPRKLW